MLKSNWLSKDHNTHIAVFMVWSDQKGASEGDVAPAARLLPDRRVRQYWDGDEAVGRTFEPLLNFPAPAWDTWMLFDKSAVWEKAAPSPSWWEHQSYGPEDRILNGSRFARHARSLEASS